MWVESGTTYTRRGACFYSYGAEVWARAARLNSAIASRNSAKPCLYFAPYEYIQSLGCLTLANMSSRCGDGPRCWCSASIVGKKRSRTAGIRVRPESLPSIDFCFHSFRRRLFPSPGMTHRNGSILFGPMTMNDHYLLGGDRCHDAKA